MKTDMKTISKYNLTIVKPIAVISENDDGWRKELNVVSWRNQMPKYDIRSYAPDYSKVSKGITLTADEMRELKAILNSMEEF